MQIDEREIITALIRLRKNRRIRQKEIADKLGMSQSKISRWENGKDVRLHKLEDLRKYAEALGYIITVDFVKVRPSIPPLPPQAPAR